MELKSLDDLRGNPENPRAITEQGLTGLMASIAEFGDLSGIVWNARTGHLVCGHQRMRALREKYEDDLKLEEQEIVTPDGLKFPVRVVDWPPETERAANVIANLPAIQGHFTAEVIPIIEEIATAFPDLGLAVDITSALDLVPIPTGAPSFDPVDSSEQGRLDEKEPVTCPECGHQFVA